jgi:hypothetical protein
MENVAIFYGHLEYFTAVWYILWPFGNVVAVGIFPPILVCCAKKNLATLTKTAWLYTVVARGITFQKILTKTPLRGPLGVKLTHRGEDPLLLLLMHR